MKQKILAILRHPNTKLVLLSLLVIAGMFYLGHSYAAETIGQVATRVTGSFRSLAKLITAAAYIAGLGFAVGAVLKFKQHKDNPTQIPIGTPVALIFIAAALIFLPTLFSVTGVTVFGSGAKVGGPSGTVFLGDDK